MKIASGSEKDFKSDFSFWPLGLIVVVAKILPVL